MIHDQRRPFLGRESLYIPGLLCNNLGIYNDSRLLLGLSRESLYNPGILHRNPGIYNDSRLCLADFRKL